MNEAVVLLDAGDHLVPATIVMPSSADEDLPVPAVLLLHGTDSDRDEGGSYVQLASDLADAGIASIRIDFVGAGESTADPVGFDLDNAIGDAQAALDHLTSLPGIDQTKLGVFGWSQGGLHALRLASVDDRVRAVVSCSARSRGVPVTDAQREEAAKNGYFTKTFVDREPTRVGQRWIDGMDALDMRDVVEKVSVPLLVLHGEEDEVVPPESAGHIASWADDVTLLMVPGAKHSYTAVSDGSTMFHIVRDESLRFFSANLMSAQAP